jgi:hypothetical protein
MAYSLRPEQRRALKVKRLDSFSMPMPGAIPEMIMNDNKNSLPSGDDNATQAGSVMQYKPFTADDIADAMSKFESKFFDSFDAVCEEWPWYWDLVADAVSGEPPLGSMAANTATTFVWSIFTNRYSELPVITRIDFLNAYAIVRLCSEKPELIHELVKELDLIEVSNRLIGENIHAELLLTKQEVQLWVAGREAQISALVAALIVALSSKLQSILKGELDPRDKFRARCLKDQYVRDEMKSICHAVDEWDDKTADLMLREFKKQQPWIYKALENQCPSLTPEHWKMFLANWRLSEVIYGDLPEVSNEIIEVVRHQFKPYFEGQPFELLKESDFLFTGRRVEHVCGEVKCSLDHKRISLEFSRACFLWDRCIYEALKKANRLLEII